MLHEIFVKVPEGEGDYGSNWTRGACSMTIEQAMRWVKIGENRGFEMRVFTQGKTVGRLVYETKNT